MAKYRKKPVVIDAIQLHDPDKMESAAAHDANDKLADFMTVFQKTCDVVADALDLPQAARNG